MQSGRKSSRHPYPRPRHVARRRNDVFRRPLKDHLPPYRSWKTRINGTKRTSVACYLDPVSSELLLENETRRTKRSPPSWSDAKRSRYRGTAITRSEAQRYRYVVIIARYHVVMINRKKGLTERYLKHHFSGNIYKVFKS